MWRTIWCIRGNGRRVCTIWVIARSSTASGSIWLIDRAEADAALKKLIDKYADDAGAQIAECYALREDPEKMFEWLEHGWAAHDSGVTELLDHPFLLAYKDDP